MERMFFILCMMVCIISFSCSDDGSDNALRPQWSHQAYLKAPNNSDFDQFGTCVAISEDTIAVGAPSEASNTTDIINGSDLNSTNNSGNDNGAVYIFTRSGTVWSHQAYLKAPNTSNVDHFGYAVSISGDTVAVGVPHEDSNTTNIIHGSNLSSTNTDGFNNGAVYVFARTNNTWYHEAYLKAPNGSDRDTFGSTVSISGDTIAVGAPDEDSDTTWIIHGSDLNSANDLGDLCGAVYVFKRTNNTWSHQAYLKAPNNSNDDQFGYSVAISGDTIAVGATNEQSSTTEIISGTDLSASNDNGNINGAVYVFVRNSNTWFHQAYLKAPNNSDSDHFGYSISISGDTIAVGVPFEDSNTTSIINGNDLSSTNNFGTINGAVYVFTRSNDTWSHQAYLKSPNNSDNDYFGYSVSVSEDTIAVGSQYEDSDTTGIINSADLVATNNSGENNGAVYVFKRSGDSWSHQAYLKAPNNGNNFQFGCSVSVSGNTIAVGSQYETSDTTDVINSSDLSGSNNDGINNGAVYVFTLQ